MKLPEMINEARPEHAVAFFGVLIANFLVWQLEHIEQATVWIRFGTSILGFLSTVLTLVLVGRNLYRRAKRRENSSKPPS